MAQVGLDNTPCDLYYSTGLSERGGRPIFPDDPTMTRDCYVVKSAGAVKEGQGFDVNRIRDNAIDTLCVFVMAETKDVNSLRYIAPIEIGKVVLVITIGGIETHYDINHIDYGNNPVLAPTMVLYLKETRGKM